MAKKDNDKGWVIKPNDQQPGFAVFRDGVWQASFRTLPVAEAYVSVKKRDSLIGRKRGTTK